LSFSENADVNM